MSSYKQGQSGVSLTSSSNYELYTRTDTLSLADCKTACQNDPSCLHVTHNTSCHLYKKACTCAHNSTQHKYLFSRNSNGRTLATFTNTDYHLSTCSDKCVDTDHCKEFTVKANGDCVLYDKCNSLSSTGSTVSDHYIGRECELVNKCDTDPNTISIPAGGWDTTQQDETPNRSSKQITIPGFKYSNPDCGHLFYEIKNHESSYMSLWGDKITYKSNIKEPKTLKFDLVVTAEGGTRTQTFSSSILIQGCDNEANTITNPS